VKAPDLKAAYRIRSNFAIIWAAAALAIDYKILPWKKARAFNAIAKCFHRAVAALQSPATTEAAQSGASNSVAVFKKLKEKLDQCELRSIELRKKPSEYEVSARQRADGFIIDGVPHLKHDRFKTCFPNKSDRSMLRKAGIFRTNRHDTPTVARKIGGIEGRLRYYAVNVEALARLLARQ
jgi:hypothetical protein